MIYELGQANRLGNRSSNQDRFAAIETEEGVLLALGDGMGGQASGDVAAQMLVDTARRLYLEAPRPIAEPAAFLGDILRQAHAAIEAFGDSQRPPTSPGTTGVLCLVQENEATWAHVGDSRFYLFHDCLPLYRTTDHSYVEMLYQRGDISLRELERHPRRNQITQCLGGGLREPLEPELSNSVVLHEKDILLLCSDGLWGSIDEAVMGRMLCHASNLDDTVNTIAEQAEQLSYPRSDNISAIALRMVAVSDDGKHYNHETTELPPAPPLDPLQSAIADIEEVIRRYEDEIKK